MTANRRSSWPFPHPKGGRSCEQTIRLRQETFCNLLLKGVVGKDAVWHSRLSGVNYLGRSATIILSGWLSLIFRGGVSCVVRVSVGVPGWAEHGKEPVGRLDAHGPARGAARRGGIVVAAPGTCEAVTTTCPIPSR
jgi:hypothetical protein